MRQQTVIARRKLSAATGRFSEHSPWRVPGSLRTALEFRPVTAGILEKPTLPHASPPRAAMVPSLLAPVLRVPLLMKLLGANAALFLAAFVAHEVWPDTSMAAQLWITLGTSFAVST